MMFLKSKYTYVLAGLLMLALLPQAVFSHGMSEAEKQAIIDGGNLSYLWLGATHMLSGYDHLAFVFGIVFFLSTFRSIAKYVTAFTLGHSVSLIYATFKGIQVNYYLIDAVIALSVCYIAFANIDGFKKYLNIDSPNLLTMIIGLGLIHGLGLSTRLQELPLSEDNLLLNIISFNVGIEAGQIGALALMLLLIARWRKRHSFKAFSLIANYGLILMGGLLFLMQMHGYTHTNNPEAFVSNTSARQPSNSAQFSDGVSDASQNVSWQDTITVTVPARNGIEYKLHLKEGGELEYTWQTDGTALFFDFHGDPAGDTSGYFKSYKESTDNQSAGKLKAPFEGIHGWYWENNTSSPVIITLRVKGDYQRLDLKDALEKPKPDIIPDPAILDILNSI